MDIEIIEFTPDRKGLRLGFVDFKVIYSAEKEETFRGIGFFEKENKKWLSFASVERNGKWLPRYSRKPSLQNLFHQALEVLEQDIRSKSVFSGD